MPNGKVGDHPFTDVVVHGLDVYSPSADALIREIDQLGGREQIADMLLLEYGEPEHVNVEALEAVLTEIRNRLLADGRRRDWEV